MAIVDKGTGSAIGAETFGSAKEAQDAARKAAKEQAQIKRNLEAQGRSGLSEQEQRVRNFEKQARQAKQDAQRQSLDAKLAREISKYQLGDAVGGGVYTPYMQQEMARIAASVARQELEESGKVTLQLRNLETAAAHAWMRGVTAEFSATSIETHSQWLRAMARVAGDVARNIYNESRYVFNRMAGENELRNAYITALRRVTETDFILWVNDQNTMPPILMTPGRLRLYSQILKDKVATEILPKALSDALTEAVAGLSSAAWPEDYTQLIRNRIAEIGEPGGKFEGFKVVGETINNWHVTINFWDYFGDESELNAGFHRGALLKSAKHKARSGVKVNYDEFDRVKLPFWGNEGQLYEMSPTVRYRFVRALMANKRVFYGKFKNRQKAIKGRRRGLKYLGEQTDKGGKVILGQAAKWSRDHSPEGIDNFLDKMDAYKSNRLEAERIQRKMQTVEEDTVPLKIPGGLWKATIGERVAAWERMRSAPIWLYLEFGQLQYQPVIPPRTFIYRFYTKAKQMIDKLVRETMDAELRAGGVQRTATGLVATGTPIRFGPHTGETLRRGTRLGPDSASNQIYQAMTGVLDSTRRNIEEAMKWEQPKGPLPPKERVPSYRPLSSFHNPLDRADYLRTVPHDMPASVLAATRSGGGSDAYLDYAIRRDTAAGSAATLNFGQRMAILKKKRMGQYVSGYSELKLAQSLGESVEQYRKRKAWEKDQLEKAQKRAKIKKEKELERAKAKKAAARERARRARAKKKKP